MLINDLETLDKLLLLCHKRNVHTIVVDGLTIQLTPTDQDAPKPKNEPGVFLDPLTGQPMSDEEIMMWGVQPRS